MPVQFEALKLEVGKKDAVAAELQAALKEVQGERDSLAASMRINKEESQTKIDSLSSSLETSQVNCRTSLGRAQINAANAMEAIDTAEKHAQGLSAQIADLKMEKVDSEQQLAALDKDEDPSIKQLPEVKVHCLRTPMHNSNPLISHIVVFNKRYPALLSSCPLRHDLIE